MNNNEVINQNNVNAEIFLIFIKKIFLHEGQIVELDSGKKREESKKKKKESVK